MGAKPRRHEATTWTAETLSLAQELAQGAKPVGRALKAAGGRIEARLGRDSLWLLIRTGGGGSYALRTAHTPGGGLTARAAEPDEGLVAAFEAESAAAVFRVELRELGARLLRVTTRITPKAPLLVAFWPRDLYPLGEGDDPTGAVGEVIAAQRGFNAPVVFLRSDGPGPSALLYFQNLTALNPWFKATGTTPDGVVGGQWPELGYQPPAAPNAPSPPERPLPKGRTFVLSDALLAFCPEAPKTEIDEARMFLEGLASVYPHIEKPKAEFRDWPAMAERTLRALSRSPKLTVSRYGHRYVRPYTGAEVPDSMVQLAVLLPIKDYGGWRGRPVPLEKAMRAGVAKFFDPKLGSLRRYLPNVADGTETIEKAKDKDPNEVDSWYLYHPLANLGRLAQQGDRRAKALFLGSLDYATKVARHFKYQWPVLFDVVSLKVNTGPRKPGQPGQSDVGGLYAYVMLQAHELTGEDRFVDEARRAIQATKGLRFELLYQTNITAWGVMACAKLAKLTGESAYHERMLPFVAGFFHNTIFWESEVAAAAEYQTFLGATCLHDAPYMAIYECFESFAAFRDYLDLMDEDIEPSVRLLMNEYCRMALSRAWGFYPGELPEDVPSKENRNGHIDRKLAVPLEDLYADGRNPGQVGQEVYGAGAALVFASRAFHHRPGVPFTVFCDYPLRNLEAGAGGWSASIQGWPEGRCRLRILNAPRSLKVTMDGRALRGRRPEPHVWEAEARGTGRLSISS